MAHSKQALKRARQSEKARVSNKAKISSLKTVIKALHAVVTTGDAEKADALALQAFQIMDKAAKTRTIHPNKAARHKSQVMRAVSTVKKKK
ncbi:MAG: hypothetical protein RLZZ562_527 [Planctomycetota bacterium]|jgi:small subunit ribosomal protein S20